MPLIQYDKRKKELVVDITDDEKRYDQLGRELHEKVFKDLDCIFRNVGLLPKSCVALKSTECSFPIGWKIRKARTNEHFTCDVWNKSMYRDG